MKVWKAYLRERRGSSQRYSRVRTVAQQDAEFQTQARAGGLTVSRWCRENYVNERSLSKAADIEHQLADLISSDSRRTTDAVANGCRDGLDASPAKRSKRACGLSRRVGLSSCGEDLEIVRRALAAGLFVHTAARSADADGAVPSHWHFV
eukprot:SAG31_NODE_4126_length_3560_cov_2.073678_5_plen_150_part_00